MSLLSKLLKEGKKELAPALDALKEAAQKAGVDSILNEIKESQAAANEGASRPAWSQPAAEPASSGFSWGDTMPAEENQYSFHGSYIEYFDKVFSEEFPQYRITRESANQGRSTVYSFWQGERKALVAELMTEKSNPKKLRSTCAMQGIPYVRFYYDHDGWWNTRSYVIHRTRAALGA